MTERVRWAKYFNVPIIKETPPNFPPLTLTVMRAICALSHIASPNNPTAPAAQSAIIKALDEFYTAYWVQGRIVTEKDVLHDVLGKAVSNEVTVDKVLEVAGGEGKQLLLRNTEKAFEEGAFGLPWMVCENVRGEKEGFWGVDHLGCVLEFLGIEKPRTGTWKAML